MLLPARPASSVTNCHAVRPSAPAALRPFERVRFGPFEAMLGGVTGDDREIIVLAAIVEAEREAETVASASRSSTTSRGFSGSSCSPASRGTIARRFEVTASRTLPAGPRPALEPAAQVTRAGAVASQSRDRR